MTQQLRSVDDVRSALVPHGIAVEEVEADTSTAPLAAAALGTTVGSIVKSLLFVADDGPVLVLACGDRQVDRAALARDLGANAVRLARPQEVKDLTGYAVGGVPPIAHVTDIPVYMDQQLLDYSCVFAAAGSPNAIFPVAPRVLERITGATLTDALK